VGRKKAVGTEGGGEGQCGLLHSKDTESCAKNKKEMDSRFFVCRPEELILMVDGGTVGDFQGHYLLIKTRQSRKGPRLVP
jgi:hypothetical protein